MPLERLPRALSGGGSNRAPAPAARMAPPTTGPLSSLGSRAKPATDLGMQPAHAIDMRAPIQCQIGSIERFVLVGRVKPTQRKKIIYREVEFTKIFARIRIDQ